MERGFFNIAHMADYRYNCDHRDWEDKGPSQGAVLDVTFSEESSGDADVIIPLDEVKNFCKIDGDDDDTLIGEIQLAAIVICEGLLNIGFRQRATIAIIDNRNGGLFLPYGPVGTVSLIKDKAPEDKQVSGNQWKQILWPCEDRLTVEYVGGYATLPYQLKTGLLQCIFYLYDERKRREDPFPPIYLETLRPFSRNM